MNFAQSIKCHIFPRYVKYDITAVFLFPHTISEAVNKS